MKRLPCFYEIFKSIKVYCSFDMNWKNIPDCWSVELKAFNTKRNLVLYISIQRNLSRRMLILHLPDFSNS